MLGREQLSRLAQLLRSTTPEQPGLEYRCEMRVGDAVIPVQLICQAMWSFEEPPQYTGVIGKVIEQKGEEKIQ